MSVFTRQVKDVQTNFAVYAIVFLAWIVGGLVLIGFSRRAWGGENPTQMEVAFMFLVAGMSLWTAYYVWLNAYVWLTRNSAGQKREILESQADEKYRTR